MTAATPQGTPLRAVAVLPARIGSTRLPRKVLLAETGLPLFVHSARNAARCPAIARVLVATDSAEVAAAGRAEGVEVVLTSPDHASGTDRVQEAAAGLGERYDVVLNVQADEPDVEPDDLAALVAAFADPALTAATLATPITDASEHASPSVVKVVRDAAGRALYFSRAPIPTRSHRRTAPGRGADEAGAETLGLRHVGVYAFRPEALARFCALPVGRLEALESLEQLRWLEAGETMLVVDARRAPRGIDTPDDYRAFVARLGSPDATRPR